MSVNGHNSELPDDPRKLLGGYATGTLTDAELKFLMEAALDDQELFDQLHDEVAMQELLDQPGVKDRLLDAVGDRRSETPPAVVPARVIEEDRQPWFRWDWSFTMAGAVAVAAIAIVFLTLPGEGDDVTQLAQNTQLESQIALAPNDTESSAAAESVDDAAGNDTTPQGIQGNGARLDRIEEVFVGPAVAEAAENDESRDQAAQEVFAEPITTLEIGSQEARSRAQTNPSPAGERADTRAQAPLVQSSPPPSPESAKPLAATRPAPPASPNPAAVARAASPPPPPPAATTPQDSVAGEQDAEQAKTQTDTNPLQPNIIGGFIGGGQQAATAAISADQVAIPPAGLNYAIRENVLTVAAAEAGYLTVTIPGAGGEPIFPERPIAARIGVAIALPQDVGRVIVSFSRNPSLGRSEAALADAQVLPQPQGTVAIPAGEDARVTVAIVVSP